MSYKNVAERTQLCQPDKNILLRDLSPSSWGGSHWALLERNFEFFRSAEKRHLDCPKDC